MLKWLFGRRAEEAPRGRRTPRAAGDGPGRASRPRPASSPTANRPGVTVHAATADAAVAAPERTPARPGASKLGPAGATPLDRGLAWAAVVLSGEARGDVVLAPDGGLDLPRGNGGALRRPGRGRGGVPLRIPRDALTGTGLPGITGARVLARTASHAVLRLGPPPAARWAVVGLRSVAVFTGKLTLFDGDEGLDVWAGHVAFVADPTATLYIQAGNDTAVAIAFAAPRGPRPPRVEAPLYGAGRRCPEGAAEEIREGVRGGAEREVEPVDLLRREPPDLERLVGREGLGALRQERRAVDGDDDGPARVGVGADEPVDPRDGSALLPRLAQGRGLERLAPVDVAAGEDPLAVARLDGPLHEEDRPAAEDQAARGDLRVDPVDGAARGADGDRLLVVHPHEPLLEPLAALRAEDGVRVHGGEPTAFRLRGIRRAPPRPSRTAPSRSAASAADIATASVPWPGKAVSPTMWSPSAPSVGSRARRPKVACVIRMPPTLPPLLSRVALERPRRSEVLVRDRRGQARHLALERLAQEEARLFLLPPVLLAPQRRPRGRFDVRRDRERLASRRRDGVARRREGEEERRPVAGAPVEPRRDEAVQAARIVVHDAREAEVQDEGAPPVAEPRALASAVLSAAASRVEEARDVANRDVRQDRSRGELLARRRLHDPTRGGRGETRDEDPGAGSRLRRVTTAAASASANARIPPRARETPRRKRSMPRAPFHQGAAEAGD